MRALCLLLAICVACPAQQIWRYIRPDAQRVVALEWKAVLESPYSELVRREIPPEFASVFAGINIIEGIERAALALSDGKRLLVLEGKFDLNRLKESSIADGAVVKGYRSIDVLVPTGEEEEGLSFALVSDKLLLIGPYSAVAQALDLGARPSVSRSPGKYDLWIMSRLGDEVERGSVGIRLESGVRVEGQFRLRGDVSLPAVESLESPIRLTALDDPRDFRFDALFATRDDYGPFAGSMRVLAETAQGAPVNRGVGTAKAAATAATTATVPRPPEGRIRIYGLEEGVREIALPPPPGQVK